MVSQHGSPETRLVLYAPKIAEQAAIGEVPPRVKPVPVSLGDEPRPDFALADFVIPISPMRESLFQVLDAPGR